jgi:hypothetical protein
MRFQQDGKVYDTDKAAFLFDDHGKGYYRTKGGTYFIAFEMKNGFWPWEKTPWGHRTTEMVVKCKAFDLGLDLKRLGFEPLPDAE